MLKRLIAIVLIGLSLAGCVSPDAGLQSYVDATEGYEFLYPNGWVPVEVKSGPDVVFRDLIEQTENVSVVINPVQGDKTLKELGTPTEVGYVLSKSAIAPSDSGRKAELVNAEARESNGKSYYLLEYLVQLSNNQQRHNLASVAVSRGKLFTFNLSTTEKRWSKVKDLFERAASSFSVY